MTENKMPNDQALAYWRGLLRKRGVESLTCPACGADAWGGFGDLGVNVLEGRNPVTGEIKGIPGSVHVLGAACGKCGFLALFDRDVIGD